ncbi:catalase-related domain-containing protein [Halalkalibacter okhensis]|uniref:Catalase immune-responsive domain-containing protein n=1 Tax=Halalkalibacter okhensis TaxID=333138 RepID=A0A0B0IMQ4_9BACI|nr:catalase-related domain-containing protein [Halalkalibacter okhensis]KHF41334.1 hypothetical protein LQ50_03610 [Halalkalibacter okhensis]
MDNLPINQDAPIYDLQNAQIIGPFYRRYSTEEQDALIKTIAKDLVALDEQTKLLAVCNFFRADEELGKQVAKELNIDLTPYLEHLK